MKLKQGSVHRRIGESEKNRKTKRVWKSYMQHPHTAHKDIPSKHRSFVCLGSKTSAGTVELGLDLSGGSRLAFWSAFVQGAASERSRRRCIGDHSETGGWSTGSWGIIWQGSHQHIHWETRIASRSMEEHKGPAEQRHTVGSTFSNITFLKIIFHFRSFSPDLFNTQPVLIIKNQSIPTFSYAPRDGRANCIKCWMLIVCNPTLCYGQIIRSYGGAKEKLKLLPRFFNYYTTKKEAINSFKLIAENTAHLFQPATK